MMHLDYVEMCKREAEKSTISKSCHGAVLVSPRGEVVSKGANRIFRRIQRRNHKRGRKIGFHAEVMACWGLPDRLVRGATIYVVRVNNQGNLCYSKPCSNCQKYLRRRGVARVYYS